MNTKGPNSSTSLKKIEHSRKHSHQRLHERHRKPRDYRKLNLRKKINIPKPVKVVFLVYMIYLVFGATLPFAYHKTLEVEEVPSSAQGEVQLSEQSDTFSYYGEAGTPERVMLIDDNMDALIYRLQVIDSAEKEIVLSTFSFMTDESGTDIMSALVNAADRGVSVKVLIDGMAGQLYLSNHDTMRAFTTHPNIEVKYYNPIDFLKPWTINARFHEKFLLADEQTYILGGRNLYNLFLGDYSEKKREDNDLLIYVSDEVEQEAAKTEELDTSASTSTKSGSSTATRT